MHVSWKTVARMVWREFAEKVKNRPRDAIISPSPRQGCFAKFVVLSEYDALERIFALSVVLTNAGMALAQTDIGSAVRVENRNPVAEITGRVTPLSAMVSAPRTGKRLTPHLTLHHSQSLRFELIYHVPFQIMCYFVAEPDFT